MLSPHDHAGWQRNDQITHDEAFCEEHAELLRQSIAAASLEDDGVTVSLDGHGDDVSFATIKIEKLSLANDYDSDGVSRFAQRLAKFYRTMAERLEAEIEHSRAVAIEQRERRRSENRPLVA